MKRWGFLGMAWVYEYCGGWSMGDGGFGRWMDLEDG